jgi:mRNA degradation ribonuclease J1/J2
MPLGRAELSDSQKLIGLVRGAAGRMMVSLAESNLGTLQQAVAIAVRYQATLTPRGDVGRDAELAPGG